MVQDKQFVRLGLVELQQRDGQGQVVQEYAWDLSAPGGIGGLLITQANKESFTYLYNHLGHVQKVMNSLGQVVANYQYTPYGQVEGDDFSQQPFGYSTKRSDFESGLIYFGYRFYSPYQRRWLNRDWLHEQGGINLYSYLNGDPLNYVVPTGLFKVCRRPISFLGDYMSSGTTGLNLGIFHEHGFYEDGSLDNTGFRSNGLFDDRENLDKYQCSDKSYNDEKMRQAQKNIENSWEDGYNLITSNCRDYIDALIGEYNEIK